MTKRRLSQGDNCAVYGRVLDTRRGNNGKGRAIEIDLLDGPPVWLPEFLVHPRPRAVFPKSSEPAATKTEEHRALALQLATQIVLAGTWPSAGDRYVAALQIASAFNLWLGGDDLPDGASEASPVDDGKAPA